MLKNVSRFTRPLAVPASSSSSSIPCPSSSSLPPSSFPHPSSSSHIPRRPQAFSGPPPMVGVFWDSQNSGCFRPIKALRFLNEIKKIAGNPHKFIRIYEDEISSNPALEELLDSGVQATRFLADGKKDVADHLMSSDMFAFAAEYPESTLVVVTGDSDFSYPLHTLSQRGHRIILLTSRVAIPITPENAEKNMASTDILLSCTSPTDLRDLSALSNALDQDLGEGERQSRQRTRRAGSLMIKRDISAKKLFDNGMDRKQAWDVVKAHLMHLEDQPTRLPYSLQRFGSYTGQGYPLPPLSVVRMRMGLRRPASSLLQHLREHSS